MSGMIVNRRACIKPLDRRASMRSTISGQRLVDMRCGTRNSTRAMLYLHLIDDLDATGRASLGWFVESLVSRAKVTTCVLSQGCGPVLASIRNIETLKKLRKEE